VVVVVTELVAVVVTEVVAEVVGFCTARSTVGKSTSAAYLKTAAAITHPAPVVAAQSKGEPVRATK
jgi:hypothetical protein